MEILSALEEAFKGEQQLFIAFGVINPACRKDEFASFLGVLDDHLSITFNGCTPGQLLDHIG